MATKKKDTKVKKAVAKPAGKPAPNKKAATPLKKGAAKPAAKTVVKKASPKPAKSKPVAAKAAPKKAAPAPKKAVVAKKEVKAVTKPVAKPAVTKAVAAPVAKPTAKVVAKAEKTPVAKPVAAATKPTNQPLKTTIPTTSNKEIAPKTTIMTEKKTTPAAYRFSDTELKEFRDLINGKLAEARTELINLNAAIISANENGTDDTGASFKMLEDGSDTLAKEEAAQLAARQKKFIEQLEAALVRIENKTYGICRVTGKLIPKERLRAVPHTTQSMEAKMQQYKD
jgi:RNA polymerase-binding transcription factor DksA